LPIFPTPFSFGALASYVPFEVYYEETRIMALSYNEDPVIVA